MKNKRPANWWNSTPKIVNGKVLCVAILPNGEETTNLFTLEELARLLTPDAGDKVRVCPVCGGRLIVKPDGALVG
jgi:hypothetical protein